MSSPTTQFQGGWWVLAELVYGYKIKFFCQCRHRWVSRVFINHPSEQCVCAGGKVLIYSFARVNQLFKDLHGK